jgi:actin-related protein
MKREKFYIAMITFDFYNTKLNDVYCLIIKTILDYSLINSVKIFPKTILPIFCSGYSSGIVIDMGHIFTHIIPINNGYPYLDISEVLSIGSSELERNLKNFIISDNSEGKTKIKNFESFNLKLFPHLDDLLVRSAICGNKSIMLYQDEINKLKNEYSKVDCYSDIQNFQVFIILSSFHSLID